MTSVWFKFQQTDAVLGWINHLNTTLGLADNKTIYANDVFGVDHVKQLGNG